MPVNIGRSEVNKDYLAVLKDAWARRRLVLFLGAGVSQAYGLMNWNDLVLDLVLEKSASMNRFWPHYRSALASWLADSYDFSPITLARVVKYRFNRNTNGHASRAQQKRFMEYVRDFLSRGYDANPPGRTTLSAVVELLDKSETEGRREGRGIPAVVTFNFDDILETKLKERNKKLSVHPVYSAKRRDGHGLPVVHVHGYLPRTGHVPVSDFVFTEDEYHRISYSVFHWSLAEVTSYLRNYTVLFVGLSMSDPNLRRLIDATHTVGSPTGSEFKAEHLLLRKEYDLPEADRRKAVDEIKLRAEKKGKLLGRKEVKGSPNVSEAIDVIMKEAHRYDRQLFKDMGVGTVWVKDYNDIPLILDEIAK